jgi:hypothetical protein
VARHLLNMVFSSLRKLLPACDAPKLQQRPGLTVTLTSTLNRKRWRCSKSKSLCSWQSVNQSVLVSSPFWGSWPDSTCVPGLTITVLVTWGAPSDEGAGLSCVWSLSLSFDPVRLCMSAFNCLGQIPNYGYALSDISMTTDHTETWTQTFHLRNKV